MIKDFFILATVFVFCVLGAYLLAKVFIPQKTAKEKPTTEKPPKNTTQANDKPKTKIYYVTEKPSNVRREKEPTIAFDSVVFHPDEFRRIEK